MMKTHPARTLATRNRTPNDRPGRRLTALAAVLLSLLPAIAFAEPLPDAVFAGAAPAAYATTFSLGLEATLAAAPTFAGDELAALAGDPARPAVAGVRLPDVRDLSAIRGQQVTTRSFEPTHRWGGFGKWLKRHWWVPVLVGAAVVYVASDDSGDDDDALGEDD